MIQLIFFPDNMVQLIWNGDQIKDHYQCVTNLKEACEESMRCDICTENVLEKLVDFDDSLQATRKSAVRKPKSDSPGLLRRSTRLKKLKLQND
jgi:hypothetical protein